MRNENGKEGKEKELQKMSESVKGEEGKRRAKVMERSGKDGREGRMGGNESERAVRMRKGRLRVNEPVRRKEETDGGSDGRARELRERPVIGGKLKGWSKEGGWEKKKKRGAWKRRDGRRRRGLKMETQKMEQIQGRKKKVSQKKTHQETLGLSLLSSRLFIDCQPVSVLLDLGGGGREAGNSS